MFSRSNESRHSFAGLGVIGIFAAILVAFAFIAGCTEKQKEYRRDAPRSGEVNSAPADTLVFPDGFSNVASKCDGSNRVYVVFKGDEAKAAIAVVANDPRCTKVG